MNLQTLWVVTGFGMRAILHLIKSHALPLEHTGSLVST